MNIEDYEFRDSDLKCSRDSDSKTIYLYLDEPVIFQDLQVYFKKDDVIAMAKHFKLTADDLNE